MRIDHQDEAEKKLDEILAAAKAAQKAAESANGYLFWMNISYGIKMIIFAVVAVGVVVFGVVAVREMRRVAATLTQAAPTTINFPFPTP